MEKLKRLAHSALAMLALSGDGKTDPAPTGESLKKPAAVQKVIDQDHGTEPARRATQHAAQALLEGLEDQEEEVDPVDEELENHLALLNEAVETFEQGGFIRTTPFSKDSDLPYAVRFAEDDSMTNCNGTCLIVDQKLNGTSVPFAAITSDGEGKLKIDLRTNSKWQVSGETEDAAGDNARITIDGVEPSKVNALFDAIHSDIAHYSKRLMYLQIALDELPNGPNRAEEMHTYNEAIKALQEEYEEVVRGKLGQFGEVY